MAKAGPIYALNGKRVWVNGAGGMVGRALAARLASEGCDVLTTASGELDLRRQADVEAWMAANRPQAVFNLAATVGGILANDTRPAEFLYDNLAIETNVVEAARRTGVEKLVMMGSSCVYPRAAAQPVGEDSLLTGPLEPTNEWYAVAKIAGIKLAQAYRRQYGCDFIAAQPNNLFGPGDDFALESAHVVAALLSKAHAAKVGGKPSFEVWGSGGAVREFLYVDDAADALVFLIRRYSGETPINIGPGHVLSIRELAAAVARVVGFDGAPAFDRSRPDGMPKKLLDATRIRKLGWKAATGLEDGLKKTYAWFLEHVA